MTAIVGVLAANEADPQTARESLVRRLRAMRSHGDGPGDAWTSTAPAQAGLSIARHAWELPPTEPAGVVSDVTTGDRAIVADATLYFRADLRRAIAAKGRQVTEQAGSAELILAAYEVFGERCTEHLEGDFAFIIWDGPRHLMFAARDFAGRRTLFHANQRGVLQLATTINGVLAGDGVPRDVSLTTVATIAAGLWMQSNETGYRAVHELPAGHSLTARVDGSATIRKYWSPPDRIIDRRQSLADASAELQALLVDAVSERMAPSGPTAISLSGGWDSPAVFGAAQLAIARDPSRTRRVQPVSISYPAGDPGREDEIIADILRPWDLQAEWIDVETVPLLGDPVQAATTREEPFAHVFEHWNRELSRGARRGGARVILDGSGGDQLFQVSHIFLADLVRSGSLLEARRQWKALGRKGAREFYRQAVRPALPPGLSRLIARVRRMSPPAHYLERHPPFWFRGRKMAELGVLQREQSARPALPTHSHVLAESHTFLLFPYFTRIMRLLHGYALGEGVELRSPLLDERVVRFAVSRPWYERSHGKETKLVLRGAMRGVLPDSVLAPRPHRTGVTSGYFVRHLRASGGPYFRSMIDDSHLASIGLIDPARLRHAWEYFLTHDDDELAGRLYFTLQAELWLRARST